MVTRSDMEVAESSTAADLIKMASEKSSEKRVELLRRITDAYLEQPDAYSSAERYLFEDIVTKLIGKIAPADKKEASLHLSKLPDLPEALARKLATDRDIEVARPIVRDYRGLSENILIDVATNGSQDHLYAIASRPVITPPVTDVVVTRGDKRTTRTLATNQGAQFSSEGMRTLLIKAEQDADLQALIVDRADLSIDAIAKLLPMISRELVARLRIKIMDVDESIVRAHLAAWMQDRKKNIEMVDTYIGRIRKGDLNLSDVVMELILNGRLLDAASVIGATINLDRFYSFSVLTHGKIKFVVLLFRSVELSWPAADAFLRLRHAKMPTGQIEEHIERDEYEAIDAETAQRVVRFLKIRRFAKGSGTDDAASAMPAR
jgi:Uncharacterised protein conserved in bacteria (DUF2336)